ncbi:MAG: hypothetical protein ACYC63_04780 [Armatimonadota bacterium]
MGTILTAEELAGAAGALPVGGEMFAGKALDSATSNTAYSTLNAEQMGEFISLVPEGQNVMSADSRMVNVKGPEQDIANINIVNGQFVGGRGSRTRVAENDEVTPVFGGVKLNPQPFEARLSFETTRLPLYNIAGSALEGQLDTLLATYYFNQMEEAFITSDKAGADPVGYGPGSLTTIDGFITKAVADCHVYDHGAKFVNPNLFENLLSQLPIKWRANPGLRSKLRFYVPSDLESAYHFWLTHRATPMGDMMLTTDGELVYKGIKLIAVPSMPVNQAGILTQVLVLDGLSSVVLCEPSNKIIGYNPEMRAFKHPRDDGKETYVNMWGEYDCGYENVDAVAVAVNVTPTIDPSIIALV